MNAHLGQNFGEEKFSAFGILFGKDSLGAKSFWIYLFLICLDCFNKVCRYKSPVVLERAFLFTGD